MNILDIEKSLRDSSMIVTSQITNNEQIYSILNYEKEIGGTPGFRDDTIYVADRLCGSAQGLPKNLIFVGEISNEIIEGVANWIQIKAEDRQRAFDTVTDLLTDSFRFQSLQICMMDSIMNGSGLNGALDEASKILNTSIVIMDMTGKVVANSTPFLIKNPLWQESIEKGYCPPFFVDHVRDVRSKHAGEEGTGPLLRICTGNNLFYLAARVYVDGELCGYVFMIQEEGEFHRLCGKIIPLIRNEAVKYLRESSSANDAKGHTYGNLLTDIIKGIPSEQIKSRMLSGDIHFPEHMCVAVLKPRYFHGDNYVRDSLAKTVKSVFPDNYYVYYQKTLVVLLALDDSKVVLPEDYRESLQNLCNQEHLICGVSNPFSKPLSMKHYYDQAVKTIDLAGMLNCEGDLFQYLDFAIYDMIGTAAQQRKIVFCCHPALATLRSYDTQNDSQLYDTLRALVNNGFNQAQTAGELFLHRNTLSYRKQKIISLTGIDLEDWKTQFLLYYSFLLEDYNDKIQQ